MSRDVKCFYNQPDPKIQALGDLKIQYATTQSFIIGSLLRQTEDLIMFRVGSIDKILERIKQEVNPTTEEKCCFVKLKKYLKSVKW